MGNPIKDITGMRFGKLIVIEITDERSKRGLVRWLCKCDCGKTIITLGSRLREGSVKSCGCYQRELISNIGKYTNTLPDGVSNFNYLLWVYKYNAKKDSREFSLSDDYVRKITKQNCYYCGISPSTVWRKQGSASPYIANGIDRINNNLGYTVENCVPCCRVCNIAKHEMNLEDFFDWVRRVNEHISKY
jgi:hypothetical protein